jgi:hypothetical protein
MAFTMVAFAVGANDSLVCCEPGELVPLAVTTRVCFGLSPPRGDASFLFVSVGFRLFLSLLTMVALVASVRRWTLDVTARGGQCRLSQVSYDM